MTAEFLKKLGNKIGPNPTEREVKCVVVGDNAIGKTRLICSYVYNTPCTRIELLNSSTHTPTIFANENVDKTLADRQLRHSYGGKNANLVIWDTFGDHDKNREYSLHDADVVLVCFNIGSLPSLESVASHWLHEIKKNCRRTPVVLVGLQADRRHNDAEKYFTHDHKIYSLREYLQCDDSDVTPALRQPMNCVGSDIGRKVASNIGACAYFETSVATRFGVQEVFSAAVKLGIMRKKLSEKNILTQQIDLLQSPFLCQKSCEPEIGTVNKKDTFFFRSLFNKPKWADVDFVFKDKIVCAHSLVLSLSVPALRDLFKIITAADLENVHDCLSEDQHAFRHYTIDHVKSPKQPRFQFVMEGIADDFQKLLEFYYTGCITDTRRKVELLKMAVYCEFNEVSRYLSGKPDEPWFMRRVVSHHIQNMGHKYLNNSFLSDTTFRVDGDLEMKAHRLLLGERSEVFSAMLLNGDFLESSTSQVR